MQQVDEALAAYERSKKRFEKELTVNQEAFVNILNDLAKDISAIARYKDVQKVEEVTVCAAS